MRLKGLVLLCIQQYRHDYLFILLISIAVLTALLFNIGEIPPPYPWSDESEIAADAVATLKSGPQLFYPEQLAGGSLAVWLEASWMALFGKELVGLRVLNGLINLTTALLLYLLVRQLPLQLRPEVNRWLALTASLLFAVSTWLLGLGRIATPNWSLVPLMTTLAFYCFWRSINSRHLEYLLAAGGIMGLLFYGYLPGYFVPVIPVLFLVVIWIIDRKQPTVQASAAGLPNSVSELVRTVSYLLLVMFVVAGPILVFFALNPEAVLQRPLQLTDTQELTGLSLIGQGAIDTLSAFGFYPNWLLQGKFSSLAFNPLVTTLFVIGFVMALWRWREPGYLFLLIWWLAMVAPAVLSRSASFGFAFEVWRRGVGAQPVSFVFPALAVVVIAGRWQRRAILPSLALATVLVSAGLSYWLYFGQWAPSPAVAAIFAKGPVQMVDWMEEESQANTIFIFPRRPNVSPTTRPELFTVRYLYDGPAQAAFPVMEETSINQVLTDLLDNNPTLIRLLMPTEIAVDPKGYFEYALGMQGKIVSGHSLPGYTVTDYHLDRPQPLDSPFEVKDIPFGETLRLTGQRIQPAELTAGQTLGVALRWSQNGVETVDYNARLALVDRQGYELIGVDKPFLSPMDYLTNRHWPSNSDTILYYALTIPPDTPPGPYALQVVAYNAETGARLPPANGQVDLSLNLTEIEVQPNPTVVDPAELTIAQPIGAELAAGLFLTGVESTAPELSRPGDQFRVTLLWQATKSLSQNLGLRLALISPDGKPILLFNQPQPLIVDFPTSDWLVGQSYRVNYSVRLPAALTTNDYLMNLQVVDLETAELLDERTLIPVSVEARGKVFEAPPLSHRLDIDFGDVIRLRGFEVGLSPAQELIIKLQWEALQEMPKSYKIFLHLTDIDGRIIAQVDTLPQQGMAPTTGWTPGEIIEDEIILDLPAELTASSGLYRLLVGLYNQNTGQRLSTSDSDHVVLFEADRSKWDDKLEQK
jgi:hypothetical protein